MESRRRVTLYDQMSAVDSSRNSLAGLILDAAAMATHKSAAASSRRQLSSSRTLLDIIREDDPNKKGRRSWKVFRDKLRLKRTGSAWFPAIHIPVSDIAIPNRNSTNSDTPATSTQPQTSRSDSLRRDGAITTFRDCLDYSSDDDDDDDVSDPAREGTRRLSSVISEERALSAREAEAAAAAAAAEEEEEEEPVRMSLMDLLEESDRQMGFEGWRYRMGDDEGCENEKERKEEEEEEEEEEVGEEYKGGISIEENCCVCMVRRKGAAFIPCGHTFCRHCSRELWVSRGHCPLCNNLILEVLDLF